MSSEQLSTTQLKAELKATWQRYSAVKEKMSPLLSELRKRLRAPGSRKGQGWAAWLEAGHIGICLKTANRWADEYEGKKPKLTSGLKSRARGEARPGEERIYPVSLIVTEAEEKQLTRAVETLGIEEAKRIIIEALLAAAAQKKPNAKARSLRAHA